MSEQTLLGGTDGFRGPAELDSPAMGVQNEITHYYLTSALLSLQQEAGNDGPVVIARDTRPSGAPLARASIRAAHDLGLEVEYLDVAPTPAAQKIAELTGAMATIAVTASHNPVSDNGWKGMIGASKPNPAAVAAISDRAWGLHEAANGQWSRPGVDPDTDERRSALYLWQYERVVVDHVERAFGERPLADKILVYDGANGAGSDMAPRVLRHLGATVHEINCGDGVINENCGAAQEGLESLRQAILRLDLADDPNFLGGLANDGDADRLMAVGAVRRNGQTELVQVDGNHAMYALAQGQAGIVGTLYTNSGLREKLRAEGVGFDECDNGDRYVTGALLARADPGWRRGGEFTGHLINLDWLSSGDGVAMAAWLSAAPTEEGSTFGELYQRVPLWHESMQKIRLPQGLRIAPDDPAFPKAQDWAMDQMRGEGRAVIRPSGTEPVVRVWVESPHASFPARIGKALCANLYDQLLTSS